MKTVLFLISALLLAGCGNSPEPKAASAGGATPVSVQVMTVASEDWPSVYEAVGTVKARTTAVLSAKVMGYVREVRVNAGDQVREGQLLAVLDARDLDTAYRQAEASRNEARSAVPEVDSAIASAKVNLDLAKVTFGRMQDLFNKRSISNQEFDEASAKLKVAEASYAMAAAKRSQLDSKIAQADQALASAAITQSYAQITAPFAGIVTERTAEPGSLAAPGAPLLTLERAGAFRFEVPVEESKLARIRLGQPVTVALDALDHPVDGRVSEIVPAVDAAARTFTVKIDLPATARLRSGLFGRARFAFGIRPVVAVLAPAIIDRGQLTSVFVAANGRATMRLVTLGEKSRDRVEVLSGLSPGDQVIVPVPSGLADGAAVEVRP